MATIYKNMNGSTYAFESFLDAMRLAEWHLNCALKTRKDDSFMFLHFEGFCAFLAIARKKAFEEGYGEWPYLDEMAAKMGETVKGLF